MALRTSRYSKLYLKMATPDVAHYFPRNVFIREPNKASYKELNFDRKALWVRHENILDSTMIHLTERFTNTELFLIGTMNTSNLLAKRTQQLIREVKPDVVYLQANEQWATAARLLEHVKSQEEMNIAKNELKSTTGYTFHENLHSTAFKYRWKMFKALFYYIFTLPHNWDPLLPGLEMKFAMEEANKAGSRIVYLGHEFDQRTWQRLYHENRYTMLSYFWNYFTKLSTNFLHEIYEFKAQIHSSPIQKSVESAFDQYTINWMIQLANIIFPEVKRIVIDKKDEDLFKDIIEHKGNAKKMVVVVNQMHMEGIEHHWCQAYGQTPRNQPFRNIDPIGDMDLRDTLFENMYHVITREIKTSYMRSTPASYSGMMTSYSREGNFQYEHRNM